MELEYHQDLVETEQINNMNFLSNIQQAYFLGHSWCAKFIDTPREVNNNIYTLRLL